MMLKPKFHDPWMAAMMAAIPDKRALLPGGTKFKPKAKEVNRFPMPRWAAPVERIPRDSAKGAKRIARVRNRLARGWFIQKHYDVRSECKPTTPPKPFESAHGFGHGLQKRGFKLLGSGYFSEVFAKEGSDKVIKVCRRPDGWMDYALWASKEGYAGSHAPKVYSYKMMPAGFYVAVVERMDMTVHKLNDNHKYKVVTRLVEMAGAEHAIQLLDFSSPGLGDFTSKLRKEFKGKSDMRLDLHNDNFMVRKDGSLCLTDPVAYGKPTVPPRLKARDFTSLAVSRYLR